MRPNSWTEVTSASTSIGRPWSKSWSIDVLEQNEGTGLHQNVLFGRAGEIYKRIQTSLLYDDDGTEAEEDDDKNRSNKKKALNLPRKNRRVIINPEEDFDDDEP